ncbi:unnamed protein product, partial [Closterium sp. Yama58-4]
MKKCARKENGKGGERALASQRGLAPEDRGSHQHHLVSICFSKDKRVDDGVARSLAESIEAEAFAATQARAKAQERGAAVKGSALVM